MIVPVSLMVAQNWPNDPSGSTIMSDYALSSMATPTNGCCNVEGWTTYCANCFTSIDGTAPKSPPIVGTWGYTADTDWGGISPGNVFYNFSSAKKDQIYMAYYWKASWRMPGLTQRSDQDSELKQMVLKRVDGQWKIVSGI